MHVSYAARVQNSREIAMSDDAAVTVSNAELHLNARLRRRDRRVIVAGELSKHQVDAIRIARVPDPCAHLTADAGLDIDAPGFAKELWESASSALTMLPSGPPCPTSA
jgi:hypothetical protein